MQLLNESLNGKTAPEPTGMKLNPQSPVDSPALSQDAQAIQVWLIAQLAERLGLEPDEIDLNEDFANYGLNSIEAVNLSGDLENILGRRLPPTLLWDYPNIKTLSEYLAEDTSRDASIKPQNNNIPPEKAEELLERLDQMSDEEVDTLLSSMLSEEESH